jgi:hypothetical protein
MRTIRNIVILILVVISASLLYSQDSPAIFQLESTTQGMLVPRMNSAQRTAINMPAVGLLVFDTNTESLWFQETAGWVELIAGDTITAAAFIGDGSGLTGTGDNLGNHTATQSLNLNGNFLSGDGDNEGVFVSGSGDVGIGDSIPYVELTIDGSIGWQNPDSPMMYIYKSGTTNPVKGLLVHSPAHDNWGLFYDDDNDRFFITSNGSKDPALMVDVGGDWVTINTDTPAVDYELSVDGEIACEDILIEDSGSWPDYVFEKNYPLKPIEEVEAYIRAYKCLPGMPSTAVIERDGIVVGEMQKRMMEKIEELTLYIIDLNQRLAAQDVWIEELKSKVGTGARNGH